ncbi:GTP-dependent dephospho-CoA kinase family protein [Halobacterium zhouii]|uniref:GTP-dependent dephospho-CoA kinase family protein n=1 Tax=Halobacterium zhouii TaxID=2902624 RepID=UPI001E6419F6|nr:GTP-dependent dephospho-CoA kinase family protein [Halobacterium zhouii]
MPRAVATLPEDARAAFREPLGPVYEDAERLLSAAGSPVIAVGDVVTYHLVNAGAPPDVAVVDGKTEREAVTEAVAGGMPEADREVAVESDAATVSAALLSALVDAIGADGTTLIRVTGEEDLATLPAVLAAPVGASVVYGQPGEGMVLANVTSERTERVRELCELLETTEEFWSLLEN